MLNNSSLAENTFVFDLDSQNGVTHLLASVRASKITAEQRNELRDLVLLYTNGGKDASVKIDLEQRVVLYGVQPVAVKDIYVAQPDYEFGTLRPAPSFNAPTRAKRLVPPTPQPVVPPVSLTQPNPATQSSVPQSATTPVVEHVQPASPAQPVVPVMPTTTVAPAPSTKSAQQPVTAPLATAPVAPTSPQTPPSSAKPPVVQAGGSLQRIREIKSLVNDRVGNPVNLIDINNEVGREYMAALLDAMKKQNSGTSDISAMKRLENAYLLVEKTIDDHSNPPVATPVKPVAPTPPPPVMDKTNTVSNSIPTPAPPVTVQASAPVPVSVSNYSKSTSQASSVSVQTTPPIPATPDQAPEPPKQNTPVIEKVAPVTVASQTPQQQISRPLFAEVAPEPVVAQKVPITVSEQTIPPVAPSATASSVGQVSPLSQSQEKLLKPNNLAPASSIETSSVSGDALFTKQVDSGLHQLLSEWSIFKKSGLFGTGPKGREHPLFLKISNLQIPLLLAGRFEDSTQEIKQSITDYMNGWRYEQGIIYEQGETFERYLRRVILHILDLQKK